MGDLVLGVDKDFRVGSLPEGNPLQALMSAPRRISCPLQMLDAKVELFAIRPVVMRSVMVVVSQHKSGQFCKTIKSSMRLLLTSCQRGAMQCCTCRRGA